jgi:hypothetical protein
MRRRRYDVLKSMMRGDMTIGVNSVAIKAPGNCCDEEEWVKVRYIPFISTFHYLYDRSRRRRKKARAPCHSGNSRVQQYGKGSIRLSSDGVRPRYPLITRTRWRYAATMPKGAMSGRGGYYRVQNLSNHARRNIPMLNFDLPTFNICKLWWHRQLVHFDEKFFEDESGIIAHRLMKSWVNLADCQIWYKRKQCDLEE